MTKAFLWGSKNMEEAPLRCLPADRCGDVDRLNVALDRIEALPVINGKVVIDEKHNKGAGRITVNLWCRAEHEKKDQRPEVGLNKKPLSECHSRTDVRYSC